MQVLFWVKKSDLVKERKKNNLVTTAGNYKTEMFISLYYACLLLMGKLLLVSNENEVVCGGSWQMCSFGVTQRDNSLFTDFFIIISL